jgi:hypothetical protein
MNSRSMTCFNYRSAEAPLQSSSFNVVYVPNCDGRTDNVTLIGDNTTRALIIANIVMSTDINTFAALPHVEISCNMQRVMHG